MSRKFRIEQDCYDDGCKLYKKKDITIRDGVTVLVGCNGIGKTTLLHQLRDRLKKDGIPVLTFDNLKDGGNNAISSAGFYGDFNFMATAIVSSEGENIVMNMGKLASKLRHFIKTGETDERGDAISRAFRRTCGEETEKREVPKERWLLLDAIDSGLSVDNVVDIKELLFKTILKDKGDCDVYIVVSANGFEMARGEKCFDVYNGKYVKFSDYEEYRQFILDSKKTKENRYKE